jgi:hypothetical protein
VLCQNPEKAKARKPFGIRACRRTGKPVLQRRGDCSLRLRLPTEVDSQEVNRVDTGAQVEIQKYLTCLVSGDSGRRRRLPAAMLAMRDQAI